MSPYFFLAVTGFAVSLWASGLWKPSRFWSVAWALSGIVNLVAAAYGIPWPFQ